MKKFRNFTALIPAAGHGTRFDKNKNKLLFKIKKKTIFEHILFKTIQFTNTIVIVTSEKNDIELKKICQHKKYHKINFKFILQKKPNGMGYAVKLALPKIKTKYFFLIWADQLGISNKTMLNSLNFFLSNKNHAIIFPTVKKIKPYTLVIKNKNGYVINVIQSRETKIPKNYGETDCGFFVCDKLIINTFLKKLILKNKIITQKTKEFDFLKSFQFISKKYLISTYPALYNYESKGINTKRDLLYLMKKVKI